MYRKFITVLKKVIESHSFVSAGFKMTLNCFTILTMFKKYSYQSLIGPCG